MTEAELVQELRVKVAVLEEIVRQDKVALDLQAADNKRRLDDLNHAHKLNRETLATYIPREIYDKAMDNVLIRVGMLEGWKERIGGSVGAADYLGRAIWAVMGGAIIGGIMFLLKHS